VDTGALRNWALAERPVLARRGVHIERKELKRRANATVRAETAELIARAQNGDEDAFAELVAPYRRELHVHCYRILGSVQDAEDAVQETLLSAWRGLGGFEQRASLRTWLYAVATSRCLNQLRAGRRRPHVELPLHGIELPPPTELGEPVWLEPYPDALLEGGLPSPPGPEARYEMKETISLAFITALQLLPAQQRAVLVLREVLGFRASEIAAILETTEESVTSALKRARSSLEQRLPRAEPPPEPRSHGERELVARLTSALEANDVDGIVALVTDDVRVSMPPLPLEYHGRAAATRFLNVIAAQRRSRSSHRIVETRANGQPALAIYGRDPGGDVFRAMSLLVLTLAGSRIAAFTRFDPSALAPFGLPRKLPG
jgi:RNA polymerase sigma-70 factor, ECF subfamily